MNFPMVDLGKFSNGISINSNHLLTQTIFFTSFTKRVE
jgi:hypothetical protein